MTIDHFVYLSKCGESEGTDMLCAAGASFTSSGTADNFHIYTPSVTYYVWYDVDGGCSDPAHGGETGIEVDITGTGSPEDVARLTKNAMDAKKTWVIMTDPQDTYTIWIFNKVPGAVTVSANDGSDPTPNTITQINAGADVDLTHANGPQQGTEGIDWVIFTAQKYDKSMKVSNIKQNLVGRTSFRVPLGKIVWGLGLKNCVVLDVGDPNTYGETTSTSIDRFCNDANSIGGSYIIYAWIISPFTNGDYVTFPDNYNVMRTYFRCTVDGHKFTFDAKKMQIVGNIVLGECWTGS